MATTVESTTDPAIAADTTLNTFSRTGLTQDAGDWVKSTFAVNVVKTFSDYTSMLEYTSGDERYGMDKPPDPAIQEIINDAGNGYESVIPTVYKGARFRDASVGGNDAINPLPQYLPDTDIRHPFLSFGTDPNQGMGRVYSTVFDEQQTIMYMSCGVADFAGAIKFYSKSVDTKLATLMAQGDFFSIEKLGIMFGTLAGAAITLPFLPFKLISKVFNAADGLTRISNISRYYDFKATMPLYYKFVNTILAHIGVNLNMANPEGGEQTNHALAAEEMDIYRILLRKYQYMEQKDAVMDDGKGIDQIITEFIAKKDSFDRATAWDDFMSGWKMGMREAISYVGFRVGKSVNTTETITNQSGPSPMAEYLNQGAQNRREKMFQFSGGETGVGFLDDIFKGVRGLFKGTIDAIGIGGIASTFFGSSQIDIPDIWTSSDFETGSTSIRIPLRRPYADVHSYFYNICIPLSLILAASLPRATGQNAYTSPFLLNLHCSGKFTTNMGLVNSLSIVRGNDEHGWCKNGLPMAITVEMNVIDLAPAVFMALADSNWLNVFDANSTFQSYLGLLGGRGLQDTLLFTKNVKRRIEFAKKVAQNNTFNPIARGFGLASGTSIGRILTAFSPNTYLPNN